MTARPALAVGIAVLGIAGLVAGRAVLAAPAVLVSAEPTAPGPGTQAGPPGHAERAPGGGEATTGSPEQQSAPGAALPGGGAADGSPSAVATAGGEVASAAPAGGLVVVHVVGEVARPGLVTLAEGSRVADAVAAVGGATASAELAALNLARPVVDGEQVSVPGPGGLVCGAAPSDGSGAPGGSGAPDVVAPPGAAGPLDLNAADLAALDALPGIGPVLAQRILDWRAEYGRFSTVEELAEVSGIGPALLERLRELVRA